MSNSVATGGDKSELSMMLTEFMSAIDKKIDTFQTALMALDSKVEAMALKEGVGSAIKVTSHRGNRVSFGGGDEILFSSEQADSESPRRNSGRFSLGSSSSQTSKDVGTKLERPKFTIEKSFTEGGVKIEVIEDSDYLNFLDDYDHYIDQWKTIPANEGQPYPNETRVAVISIPPKYARKMASRIHWFYDTKELAFCSEQEVKDAKFWSDLDTNTLRIEIGNKIEQELSTKGVLEAVKRVKWNSAFGIIDHRAFANFQHDFKRTILRLQSGGVVKIEQIHLKDYLISALPDKRLQDELIAKYGSCGIIIGDPHNFAINSIFDDIEKYIQSISKLNLGRMVNKHNRERESKFAKGKFFQITASDDEAQNTEDEDEAQDRVNMLQSNYGAVKCRHSGLGSDGKLKCKWLASPESSCLFNHPESDMKMKGKGQSQDVPKSQMTPSKTHTRKVNMSLLSNEDEVYMHGISEEDS
jgi:hypothetical protein